MRRLLDVVFAPSLPKTRPQNWRILSKVPVPGDGVTRPCGQKCAKMATKMRNLIFFIAFLHSQGEQDLRSAQGMCKNTQDLRFFIRSGYTARGSPLLDWWAKTNRVSPSSPSPHHQSLHDVLIGRARWVLAPNMMRSPDKKRWTSATLANSNVNSKKKYWVKTSWLITNLCFPYCYSRADAPPSLKVPPPVCGDRKFDHLFRS